MFSPKSNPMASSLCIQPLSVDFHVFKKALTYVEMKSVT